MFFFPAATIIISCTFMPSNQVFAQPFNQKKCKTAIVGYEQITPSGMVQLKQKNDGSMEELRSYRRVFYIFIATLNTKRPSIDFCLFMGKKINVSVDPSPQNTPLIIETLNGLPGGFKTDTLLTKSPCTVWAINISPYTSASSSKLIHPNGVVNLSLKEKGKRMKLVLNEFKSLPQIITQ